MKYRKLRVQDLFKEEVALIIQREIRDPGMGFITVLGVKMSDDLKDAKVYLSIYGDEEQKAATLAALKRSRNYIKFLLGKRIQLRICLNYILSLTIPTRRQRGLKKF